jgi:hypothetical protein
MTEEDAVNIVTAAAGWQQPPDTADPYVVELACKLAGERIAEATRLLLPNGPRR